MVNDICDLRLEHLDIEDQRLAISPQIGWGWGVMNGRDLESSTEFRGFLFNPASRSWWFAPERYPALFGAFGSSKTLPAILKSLVNCIEFPGTRGLIMRQTYDQLIKLVLPSMFKIFAHLGWQEEKNWTHHKTEHSIRILLQDGKSSELLYRPAVEDGRTLDEIIEYLKGMEIDFVLLSEVMGIHYNVFQGLKGRVGRWGTITDDARCQLLVEGNPPDEGHWVHDTWYRHIIHDPHGREENELPDADDYFMVTGSAYLNRVNLRPSYIKALEAYTPDMRRKFLYGQTGYLPPQGIPVFEHFNMRAHLARDGIEIPRNATIYRGFDLSPTGRHMAMISAFLTKNGTLQVVDELLFDGAGLDTFFQLVTLQCKERMPTVTRFIDFADPKAFDKSQTDLQSPASIAAQYGIMLNPGAVSFTIRKNAVDYFLKKQDGFKIDAKNCRVTIKGMRGSYRYKDIDSAEGVVSSYPLKNLYSHLCDALQYLCSGVSTAPEDDREKRRARAKKRNEYLQPWKHRPDSIKRFHRKNRLIFN